MRLTKDQLTAQEKAKRAVRAFRQLQPYLNSFARNLTGRPNIRIEVAAQDNGSTDGKRIFFRPPIALGEDLAHVRSDCNKRDDDQQLICAACAAREKVLATIYHEIAHIWFDSFASVSDYNKKLALEQALKERPGKYAEEVRRNIANQHFPGYMQLASQVNQFFPFLINCLEDARVNRELFRALPGTEAMFRANTACIFEEGVEQLIDGEWQKKEWREYPLNAQATLGVFCIASGYDYTGWFAPVVEAALRDVDLNSLIETAATRYSVGDIFQAAFPVLARLRELGFCKSEYEPEDEPTPPPPSLNNESDEEQGDDQQDESIPPQAGSSGEEEAQDEEVDNGESAEQGSQDDASESSEQPDGESDEPGDPGDNGDSGEPAREGSSGDSGEDAGDPGEHPESGSDSESGSEGSEVDNLDPEEAVGSDSDDSGSERPGTDEGSEAISDPDSYDGPGDTQNGSVDGSGTDGDDDGDNEESDLDGVRYDSETGWRGDSTDPSVTDGDSFGEELAPGRDEGADEANLDGDFDDELIDTGDYEQGTKVTGPVVDDGSDLPMGTPDEVRIALIKLGDHEKPPAEVEAQTSLENDQLDRVIIQSVYFETPSVGVESIITFDFETNPGPAWADYSLDPRHGRILGFLGDFSANESVVGPATLKARVAFSANQRAKFAINEKKGRIRPSALARRAPVQDARMFQRKTLPGRMSYFVLLGIDVSYSTAGEKIALAKRLAMTEAEVLHRVGVNFEVWAHSTGYGTSTMTMHMYPIKRAEEAWGDKTRARISALGPDSGNLDGHALEYFRKRLDMRNETTKILHYMTDGAMPASNHDEELEVLIREIATCRKNGYILTGIGVETDSPARHGLETIEMTEEKDIELVIANLGAKLAKRV